ncbi:MAG: PaaI family thioesterase [Eggerthellaceae bacterium]|nr:PaaI family thioesterase [Eggerthellaceae bacterium]
MPNIDDYVFCNTGLVKLLNIDLVKVTPSYAEATMPIDENILQPFGFVHGGATLTLLETVASRAAMCRTDPETERAFGVHIDVRHKKSGVKGQVRGVAELEEVIRARHVWRVKAYDDEGDVMSEGIFETKIVPISFLEEKERKRREAKERAESQKDQG